MAAKTLLTEADFDALPEKEGWKLELSQGELVMTALARLSHNLIRERLGRNLGDFVEAHEQGTVVWETDFKLAEDTVRIPDLAFLSSARMAELNLDQRPSGAPELAIEVVSPGNSPADMARKIQQYLQAGARMVWIVYPETRLVYIYKPEERFEIRGIPRALDAPALLPGWSMPLAELFRI